MATKTWKLHILCLRFVFNIFTGIEDKLREIKDTWDREVFEFTSWKDRGNVWDGFYIN